MPAKVYLIGAGPGDPELITCKGRRILQQADSILYDHLAPAELLELAPPHAERLYVGKKKSLHASSWEKACSDFFTPNACTSARKSRCMPSPRRRSRGCSSSARAAGSLWCG